LPSEIALDGLHLFVLEAEIIHVAERFAVLGPAKILHKRFVVVSDHPLQFKPFDEINLGLPAARFESALTDVVVVVRARKKVKFSASRMSNGLQSFFSHAA